MINSLDAIRQGYSNYFQASLFKSTGIRQVQLV